MDELVNLAAERAVLAGVFQYGEPVYLDVADVVRDKTFTDPSNKALWKVFKHLYENKEVRDFDQASVLAACKELSYGFLIETPEEIRHMAGIFQTNVRAENVIIWAGRIRKLEVARIIKQQLEIADSAINKVTGEEDISEILGFVETPILDLSELLDAEDYRSTKLLSEGCRDWLKYVKENKTHTIGVSSGYPLYDEAIGGGFRRGTISLIGARPKTGKSMLGLNVGINVAKQGIPVLFLDTEMRDEDHWPRAISNIARRNGHSVTINEIERGTFDGHPLKETAVDEAIDEFEKIPFHYRSVVGMGIEETMPLIRRWIHKEVGYDENGRVNHCLVIYDYVKLQSSHNLSDSLKEYQAIGFLMTSLHNFVAKYDVPLFALIQLNRDGQTQESGAAFSQSDRILWLVTNFSIFKMKNEDEVTAGGISDGNRKMVPIAARHGEGMREGDFINMYFDKKFGYIREGDTRDNLIRMRKHAQEEATDDKLEEK